MHYQTQDGLADYGFSIEYQPGEGWRVYVTFQALCQDCDNNLQFPYQSTDDDGRSYISWPSELDSLGDARTVASLWAEMVHRYRRDLKNKNSK
jgi:hypothetical protein